MGAHGSRPPQMRFTACSSFSARPNGTAFVGYPADQDGEIGDRHHHAGLLGIHVSPHLAGQPSNSAGGSPAAAAVRESAW
jgi:hypothetical protein